MNVFKDYLLRVPEDGIAENMENEGRDELAIRDATGEVGSLVSLLWQ